MCFPFFWYHFLSSALPSSHDIRPWRDDRMRVLWCVCLSTLAVQTFCSCTAGTDRQTDGSPTDITKETHSLLHFRSSLLGQRQQCQQVSTASSVTFIAGVILIKKWWPKWTAVFCLFLQFIAKYLWYSLNYNMSLSVNLSPYHPWTRTNSVVRGWTSISWLRPSWCQCCWWSASPYERPAKEPRVKSSDRTGRTNYDGLSEDRFREM